MASIAATALASCTKMADDVPANSNDISDATSAKPSVAIVGAGIAELNAAFNLNNAGISSTLYDANTRAGGRMFTAQNILNRG